jgi:hypothetical protein
VKCVLLAQKLRESDGYAALELKRGSQPALIRLICLFHRQISKDSYIHIQWLPKRSQESSLPGETSAEYILDNIALPPFV